jgi:L-ascorbate metabolism protein UlaG (beta-lactamase superfamily)
MTHAIHSCALKDGDDLIYGGEAAGYVLRFKDGRAAYFAGDTALFSDMKLIAEMYQPELALLPIGDYFTMGPDQAALAARFVGAKKVIPMHYGTFPVLTGKPEDLARRLEKDGIQVWTLKQGEPARW